MNHFIIANYQELLPNGPNRPEYGSPSRVVHNVVVPLEEVAQDLESGERTLRDFIDGVRNAPELPANDYRTVALLLQEQHDA